jgi:cytochrome bd-type quinol oxidase subunit 2
MLQGATWLVMKTEGPLQQWSRRIAQRSLWWVLAFVAAVSVWTPLASERIAERWFSWPNLLWFSPVPILTARRRGAAATRACATNGATCCRSCVRSASSSWPSPAW